MRTAATRTTPTTPTPAAGGSDAPRTRVRRGGTVAIAAMSVLVLAACTTGLESGATATPSATVAGSEQGATGAGSEPASSATATPPGTLASAALEPGVGATTCDPARHARAGAVQILGPDDYRVGGWSHLTGVGALGVAALEPAQYAITAEHYVEQPDCGGQRALETVLVKRTYDWDRQHANGIESGIATAGLVFDQVQDVRLELRIDAGTTAIPTAQELADAYGGMLTTDQLTELDGQQVNLEVTLFGDGAHAGAQTMNAGTVIAIDPVAFADGWVSVVIPRDDLEFYTESDYVRTPVEPEQHGTLAVEGLRINPETATTATVRRLVTEDGGDFDPAASPELLKEMGLTFSLIEVGRAP